MDEPAYATVEPLSGFIQIEPHAGEPASEKTEVWVLFDRENVGRFEGGWTFEAAVPFKSLRYSPGRTQIWGLQLVHQIFWKNEAAFLTRIPPEKGLGQGMMMASRWPTLVGIEAPTGSKNLDIKPYAISDITRDATATPRVSNKLSGDFGVDAKYGITKNTNLDLTYNTDFAQVEADEQQINLTRFNLFFPEKRDFFLESAGTFTLGGVTTTSRNITTDAPVLFYSSVLDALSGDFRQSCTLPGVRPSC